MQDTDLFMALTSDDEDNIMACLLAKRMGAQRVLALINRRAYADLVQGRARRSTSRCRPAQTVIGELLAHVRRGDVRGGAQPAPRRRRGAGGGGARRREDLPKVVGRRIDELELPAGAQIGAIVRGGTGRSTLQARQARSSSRTTTPWCETATT